MKYCFADNFGNSWVGEYELLESIWCKLCINHHCCSHNNFGSIGANEVAAYKTVSVGIYNYFNKAFAAFSFAAFSSARA